MGLRSNRPLKVLAEKHNDSIRRHRHRRITKGTLRPDLISDFLERLATPGHVYRCLMQLRQALKTNGKLVIMGPNFRFCANEYYDFADHLLPLSDRTIEEHLAAVDMKCERIVPRFLPLAFRSQRFSHPLLVKLYLAVPFFWRIFGKQFFIVATRTNN